LGTEVPRNAETGAQKLLDWLKVQPGENHNINLSGFSRGSITCIRIANILKRKQEELEHNPQADPGLLKKLQKLDLNMFLMDPVAGMSDKGNMDGRVIPDNVNNYLAVLQKDERRRDFKPQDLSRAIIADPAKTKVSMLPMYGNHSDTTKVKKAGMVSGPTLMWYSLHHFLTGHGTKFQDDKIPQITTSEKVRTDLPPNPSAKDLLKLFSTNHTERDAYLKSGLASKLTDGIPTPRIERSFNKNSPYYVKNSNFFVNQMERELFKVAYPKVFNHLFERGRLDQRYGRYTQDELKAELKALEIEDKDLFTRLKSRGVTGSGETINPGNPTGYNCLEPCLSMQQIFPQLLPRQITDHTQQMNKVPTLEAEVYRMTFKYEREKGESSFASERSQADRAQQIREEINTIVKTSRDSPEVTQERILDKLEQHHHELFLSKSTSELEPMIGKILADNGRKYVQSEPTVSNEILTELVHASFTLAKKAVSFAGNLGYLGGGVLYAVGNAIESIGKRSSEMIGKVGYNPLKALGFVAASLLEGVGCLIKESFGLIPLTEFLVNGIRDVRDAAVQAINTTTITPKDKAGLEEVVRRADAPIVPPQREHVEHQSVTSSYREQMRVQREEAQHKDKVSEASDELSSDVDSGYQRLTDN